MIAITSSKIEITIEKARHAFQTIANMFYREEHYLNASNNAQSDSDACEKLEPSIPECPQPTTNYKKYGTCSSLRLCYW